jgi:hypothetical protein
MKFRNTSHFLRRRLIRAALFLSRQGPIVFSDGTRNDGMSGCRCTFKRKASVSKCQRHCEKLSRCPRPEDCEASCAQQFNCLASRLTGKVGISTDLASQVPGSIYCPIRTMWYPAPSVGDFCVTRNDCFRTIFPLRVNETIQLLSGSPSPRTLIALNR